MNMFGYDDDQLNQILFGLVKDPTVMVQVTLDKSQATGVHEKQILQSDVVKDPAGYAADFAVGASPRGFRGRVADKALFLTVHARYDNTDEPDRKAAQAVVTKDIHTGGEGGV